LDVDEFLNLLSAAKNHTHAKSQSCPECLHILEDAVRLYQGDFLEGFNLGDCLEFDEWQFLKSESLRHELAEVLQKVAEGYAAHSAWEQAISCTRRWVAFDRLNESAQRYLIFLYEQAGQHRATLRQYEELRRILQDELGQKPDPETPALYHKIRDGTADLMRAVRKDVPTHSTALPFTEPLLKTKLYIPLSRGQKITRDHLIQMIGPGFCF
jgi:DNA-binding SARP family transcriptional activator